jgi:hypothetical protein
VVAKHNLPSYVPLEPEDLEARDIKSPNEGSKLVATFSNRYPKRLIAKDNTINVTAVSDG